MSSATAGGNLGQLTRGDTTPEFEQALVRLAPGEMTKAPVETRYGFHIIRLDRHIQGRQLPFALVRERIAEYVVERGIVALAQYVARLAVQATITGVELPTLTGPARPLKGAPPMRQAVSGHLSGVPEFANLLGTLQLLQSVAIPTLAMLLAVGSPAHNS